MYEEMDDDTLRDFMTKHILFVEGAGQTLIERGWMKGPVSIAPAGIAAYDQLMASGWRPQREAVRRILEWDKGVPAAKSEELTQLFMKFVAKEFSP